MPDAIPKDTLQYAESVLKHLVTSAEQVVCSYTNMVDDAEQTRSELLTPYATTLDTATADPGWHATRLSASGNTTAVADRVPAVEVGELIRGGAATVQRQLNDPFSAFVLGRMGTRLITPQAVGIPAALRGSIIHDALYKLFVDLPASNTIREWQGSEVSSRINAAVDSAFSRHERNTDAVLRNLLALERHRVARLLRQIIEIDSERGDFEIASVEAQMEFVAGNVRLPLRFDRIDRFNDGQIAILDYKSGAKKKLMRSAMEEGSGAHERVSELFRDPAAFDDWAVRWRKRLASEGGSHAERRRNMRSVNPAFIPRNHLVEEVIEAAVEEGDFTAFEQLNDVLASPYDDQPGRERYAAPPRPDQVVHQTFCGT